jgi:phage/plasmid-associated DNA primase
MTDNQNLGETIKYTTECRTVNPRTVNAREYERLCKSGLNCYEMTPNDRKLKPYFDIEIKPDYCLEGQEYPDILKAVIGIAMREITKQFPIATVAILESCSPSYECVVSKKNKWIISAHIIISNWRVSKAKLLSIVNDMNATLQRSNEICKLVGLKNPDTFGLFDNSVYDENRKIRNAFANKTHFNRETMQTEYEDRPMNIVSGTFENTCITAFFDEDCLEFPNDDGRAQSPTTVVNQPKEKSPAKKARVVLVEDTEATAEVEPLTPLTPEEFVKYREMLQLIRIDPKDRKVWLRVCSCLKQNGFIENDWLRFCNNNNLHMDEEKQTVFSKISTTFQLNVHYLQKLAKENVNAYKEWLKKWRKYSISLDELSDSYKCATIISTYLKEELVLCKEQWFMLTATNLWRQQKEPLFYITREVRKYIDYSNQQVVNKIATTEGEEKDTLIEISKTYLKFYAGINSSSFYTPLVKYLKSLLTDETFAERLDTNSGFLVFQNGVMDLKTKQFRMGIQSSDLITQTIPHDYYPTRQSNPIKKKFVYDVLLKIMNNTPAHLEYFLGLIGYSLIGSPQMQKSLYFCVDKTFKSAGDNGKTFFFDILTSIFPNYVYMTNKSFLESDNKKLHKQFALMKGKRLVWLDEFNEKKANAELMKVVADGLAYENEVMYGTSESIIVMFKLWTLTNHMPNIDPKETAVYNRYKQISYGSHFDRSGDRLEENPEKLEFIANTTYGDLIKTEYIDEVVELVIEYANKYYVDGLPLIPEQFKKDTKETQSKNDLFKCWFEENAITNDAGLRVAEKDIIDRSGMHPKLVREGMTRLGYKYVKDMSKLGKDKFNKPLKGGYEGVGLIAEDDDELDGDM